MKKQVVVHIITGLNDGGAEAVLLRLCAHEADNQYHVISLMSDGKYGPLLREVGATVTCLNLPQGRVTLGGLWRLWCVLRSKNPDVVQTWMYHADLIGGVMARIAGVKRVFWNIRNTTPDVEHTTKSTILVVRLCALLSPWVPETIVCCAQRSLEGHRDLGYTANKLCVIPNGYDLSRFAVNVAARDRLRAEWGVNDRFVLGMVGRFDPQKDHKNFLSALTQLKQEGVSFYAVLVGRGLDASNGQLVAWLAELGLADNVHLLGQRTDIPDVMNALDVHVLSSFGEAFPNVLAEAMACGTPVVTTDVGDAAMIAGDTGWVVPAKNATALAGALLQVQAAMADNLAWQARRVAARQRVQVNFSLSRMVANYKALWRNGNCNGDLD